MKNATRSPEIAAQVRAAYEQLIEPLRAVAVAHGYALAAHGSLARDIDLIAVPWTVDALDQDTVARALIAEVERVNGYALVLENLVNVDPYDFRKRVPEPKAHGRMAWSIHLGKAGAYIDLSVMPTVANAVEQLHAAIEQSVAAQRARQREWDETQAAKSGGAA